LDQPQSQVLIQVLIAEVTLDAANDLGIEWNYSHNRGSTKIGTGTDFGVAPQLRSFGGFSSMVTGSDYNFLLRALENDGRLQVLSRPQILTGDNKPATINVGQRVPLVTDSRTTPQGDTINSFKYEDVGVNLTVTPRISLDGFVRMEVSTTNSTISSSTVDVSPSVKVPLINQRRASTYVSVQSGQSVLIGGLISTSDDIRTKSVPFFGKIPVLGALFRSRSKNENRTELLILMTPQVLANTRLVQETLIEAGTMTRQQLEHSHIKNQIKSNGKRNVDDYEQQLLEPLYPPQSKNRSGASTNSNSGVTVPKDGASDKKEPPAKDKI